jgi:hypothetical protein
VIVNRLSGRKMGWQGAPAAIRVIHAPLPPRSDAARERSGVLPVAARAARGLRVPKPARWSPHGWLHLEGWRPPRREAPRSAARSPLARAGSGHPQQPQPPAGAAGRGGGNGPLGPGRDGSAAITTSAGCARTAGPRRALRSRRADDPPYCSPAPQSGAP